MSTPIIIDQKRVAEVSGSIYLQALIIQLANLANRPAIRGEPGRGIRSVAVNANTGGLTLTLTDGATVATGRLIGRSAYEVAVANGFVGSEAEWLASLGNAGPGIPDGAAVLWPAAQTLPAGWSSTGTLGGWLVIAPGDGPAGSAPVIIEQPSILPAGAGIGDSITLDLGAATGSPIPVASWDLTRDGTSVRAQVDEYMALELTEAGAYLLTVSWANGLGSPVVATPASLTVAPEAGAIDRATDTWVDITPASAIGGTASAVTSVTAGGTGALVIPTVASNADVQMTGDGLVYAGGRYSMITTALPVERGVILIAEFRPAQARDTGNVIDLGTAFYIRQGGPNLQYGYNFTGQVNHVRSPADPDSWTVLAMELDREAGTIRYWDGEEIVTVTDIDTSSWSPTQLRLGQSLLGTIRNASVAVKEPSGWTATLEQLLASYGVSVPGVTPEAPPFERLRVLPALIQSEGRPINGGAAAMVAVAPGRGIALQGLRTTDGATPPLWGAGQGQLDQTVAATGFILAEDGLSTRGSAVYATQYSWLTAQPETTAALIGDNGFGGLYVEQYLVSSTGYYGENGLYWLQEAHRVATAEGMTPEAPYFFHWIGTSAKVQPYAEARSAIEDVWDQMIAQVSATFGAAPRAVLVQTGGDLRTVGDTYHQVQAQYDCAMAYGALIATHQRIWPIGDGNIHPRGPVANMIGELCGIAIREAEAGRDWTVTASVAKSGATVTVDFALRPGETLVNRAGLYADFGGDAATAPDLGFEADGGISAIAFAGSTVTITLNNAGATWLRFARQVQDVSDLYHEVTPGDAASRIWYSAHRTTLFPSETFPSQMYPGETLWRSLPSFEGTFSGDTFAFGPT